jgi:Subtilase family
MGVHMERSRHRYQWFMHHTFSRSARFDFGAIFGRSPRSVVANGASDSDQGDDGRASNLDEEFDAGLEVALGVTIRTLRDIPGSDPAPINRRLAVVSTDKDDVLVMPGLVVVDGTDSDLIAMLTSAEMGFVEDEPDQDEVCFDGDWLVECQGAHAEKLKPQLDLDCLEAAAIPDEPIKTLFWQGGATDDDLSRTMRVLDVVREFGNDLDENGRAKVALVYGCVGSQKLKPASDYEWTARLATPVAGSNGRVIHILDTGFVTQPEWGANSGISAASNNDVDPVSKPGGFLAWGAGHGTFVAGVVRQVAPGCTVVVHKVASQAGFVTEKAVESRLKSIAALGDQMPIVLLPFGGYQLTASDPPVTSGAIPADELWLAMPTLRRAILTFLKAKPSAIVVAAAGNNDTELPCFPAAFAGFETPAANWWGRVISVGAIDAAGNRPSWSNRGSWVTAHALGVGVRSLFVRGKENPAYETDGVKETFEGFAIGDGTSFAAPRVAALLAQESFEQATTPAAAWRQRRAAGSAPVNFG